MDYSDFDKISYAVAKVIYSYTKELNLKVKDGIASCLARQLAGLDCEAALAFLANNHFDCSSCNTGSQEFSSCLRIACLALKGGLADAVYGANYFHHRDDFPKWQEGRATILILEPFHFYKI